jgi:DNA repair and recombination protein RAD54 and RAD54-like protein
MSFPFSDADWNPATCQQAMGRIYRQGQAKECTIYRLFTSGTVDEVILQRQLLKQGLSKLTVDSSDGNDAKFSKEELAECFDLKEKSTCDTKVKLGTKWPTYDPTNLSSLGCNDIPLLQVATKIPESLCFVHINSDQTPRLHDKDDLKDHCLNACTPVGYESEEEENEFTL